MNPENPTGPGAPADPGGRRVVALVVWAIVAVGLATSAFAALQWRSLTERDARADFRVAASDVEVSLTRELDGYAELVRGARGLFAGSRRVERDEFVRFAKAIGGSNLPGSRGLAYLVADGRGRPHVRYAAGSPATTLGALHRAPSFDRRIREGVPRLIDIPRSGGSLGLSPFAMYARVEGSGRASGGDAWVAAPFDAAALVQDAGTPPRRRVGLTVYDGRRKDDRPIGTAPLEGPGRSVGGLEWTVARDLYGREWTLSFRALPGFVTTLRATEPWLIAIVGAALTLLLAALVASVTRSEARALELVQRTTRTLRDSEERFRSLSASSPIGIVQTDETGRCVYANSRWEQISGLRLEDLRGRGLAEAVHPAERAAARAVWRIARRDDANFSIVCRLARPDGGSPAVRTQFAGIRDRDGELMGWVASVEELASDPYPGFAAELAERPGRDALTGLLHPSALRASLERALEDSDRSGTGLALLYLDIDGFSEVNGDLGEAAGDAVLEEVARRLASAGDHAARVGADEFALVRSPVADDEEATAACDEIASLVRSPVVTVAGEARLEATVGCALAGLDEEAAVLLSDAEDAMRKARAAGAARRISDEDRRSRSVRTRQAVHDLRRALTREELSVVYQPEFAIPDGAMTGAEALVRWHHPRRGDVAPSEFVPVAEESGLIVEIGNLVLAEACEQAARWRGPRGITLAVNLSPRQLRDPDLPGIVAAVLRRTRTDPAGLRLEITETMLMADDQATSSGIAALRDMGVRLAVDDFGTGYSSLGYLKRFPVDVVKIDGSFVRGLPHDREDRALVSAVITMAHSLGMLVVAEGVENEAQVAALGELGCDRGQGFHYSRPVPADAMAGLVTESRDAPRREDESGVAEGG